MAFSFKYTRYSAISQIILGCLCIIFGIADRVEIYPTRGKNVHTESVVPIWMGVWIVITGVIGFAGSRRIRNSDRPSGPLIGTYLAFSIVSVVFAGVIIYMYSIGIVVILGGGSCFGNSGYYDSSQTGRYVSSPTVSMERECNTSVGLGAMVIIFAVIEFGVGIWASICCCSGGCNNCCEPTASQPQMGQVMYIQTQHGPAPYVMTQGANGVSIAVPAMTPGSVVMTPGQVPMQLQNQQMMVHPTLSAPQNQVEMDKTSSLSTERNPPLNHPSPEYESVPLSHVHPQHHPSLMTADYEIPEDVGNRQANQDPRQYQQLNPETKTSQHGTTTPVYEPMDDNTGARDDSSESHTYEPLY